MRIKMIGFVMKLAAVVCTLVLFAAPALAMDIEEIGAIEATFDGANIALPTVLVRDAGEATAYVFSPGGGFTSLNINGTTANLSLSLILEMEFMGEASFGPASVPTSVNISYRPEGTAQNWTSWGAPTPPAITFATLEIAETEGRAAGTFSAVLCLAEDLDSEGDPGNCHPIEGRFDTRLLVEQ